MPVAILVDLVNGWGSLPRAEAGEQDLPFPSVATLGEEPGDRSAPWATATDRDLTTVADLVYPVFADPDPGRRAELVNVLLADTEVRPSLDATPAGISPGWLVESAERALLASAAIALRTQLADHSPARLGTCTGNRCGDVFVDASPAGYRRFCSVTCQNRARVAAYRRRRQDGQPRA
jgi:CGNR zinc finger protein